MEEVLKKYVGEEHTYRGIKFKIKDIKMLPGCFKVTDTKNRKRIFTNIEFRVMVGLNK